MKVAIAGVPGKRITSSITERRMSSISTKCSPRRSHFVESRETAPLCVDAAAVGMMTRYCAASIAWRIASLWSSRGSGRARLKPYTHGASILK